MTSDIALEQQVPPEWEPPAPPTDLIFDDGVPLASNRHRIAVNVLIRSTQQALAQSNDFFVGGNMFIYYSRNQAMNQDFRGPDFFVALGVEGDSPLERLRQRERQGWVVWEEAGRYPDVIVELLSPSTAAVDKGVKKDLYEQVFKTSDYYVFDPFDPSSLEGWRLDLSHGYQPLSPNERGWLWCESLGLWLGTWDGAIDREPMNGVCQWLRLYDVQGNLVLLPEEAEKQRADRLAAKLQELGVDPSEV
ncbi:Hypothetical Protein XM38_036090 [Halomicronema hongdechloris C2206]|uniref:Putative restriction endonuclease domain-containing protein n=1 Tax=Halomicronema hongdechloris C2206 TaxID=1641165 RepID=A0A1Z3HQR7_9CYAN|nr:Uma2 family endonuclease [Halomicronema hongdechloris]ASC72651.1 Hypothetical Protein XM38_036090 [Halomicronema hongdechloris C2206]